MSRLAAFLAEPSPHGAPRSPAFDRFCIAFPAIDWIVFGSMHFSAHGATVLMLPGWVPWPDATVAATGAAEVAAGVLMLYGRTRRGAAALSLVLLVVLLPAILHILQDEQAVPGAGSLGGRIWKVLLVPHTVLMAICSLHLLRKPYPDPWDAPGGAAAVRAGRPGWAVLTVAFVLLLCNGAGFLAIELGVRGDKPTAAMWMMMCLAVGGLLGFLFAVPRANTAAANRALLLPNRNIEAISDWLTKIIVGLGLVNLGSIGSFLSTRSAAMAPLLQVDESFVLAMILYFFVAGVLEGYLLTRVFLQWLFVDAVQAGLAAEAGQAP